MNSQSLLDGVPVREFLTDISGYKVDMTLLEEQGEEVALALLELGVLIDIADEYIAEDYTSEAFLDVFKNIFRKLVKALKFLGITTAGPITSILTKMQAGAAVALVLISAINVFKNPRDESAREGLKSALRHGLTREDFVSFISKLSPAIVDVLMGVLHTIDAFTGWKISPKGVRRKRTKEEVRAEVSPGGAKVYDIKTGKEIPVSSADAGRTRRGPRGFVYYDNPQTAIVRAIKVIIGSSQSLSKIGRAKLKVYLKGIRKLLNIKDSDIDLETETPTEESLNSLLNGVAVRDVLLDEWI
jgi:hypothetical protein